MIYLIVIVVFLALMIGVGLFTRRSAKSVEGFFVANRSQSTFLITGSLVASIIGGSATVGLAGLGFSRGLTGIWWLLVGCIGLVILGLFLASRLRGYGLFTIPQLVARQYGERVSMISSILIVIAWIGVIAGQIIATGKILGTLGIGTPQLWMIIFTATIITYTMMGGQQADIRTDIIKAFIKFAGISAAFALVMIAAGGWDGLKIALPADSFSFPVSDKFSPADLASYVFVVGLPYVVGPDIYSKIFCARDGKVAKTSAIWAAIIVAIFAVMITLLGMGAAALYPGIAPEQAFPVMIKELFPPVVGAIILAALVSATMAAADSCVLSASTIFTVDIVKKLKPGMSEQNTLVLARWAIVLFAVLSLLLAIYLNGVISSLLFAYTIFTAGVIVPTLAGFFKDKLRLTWAGAMASIIGGGVTGLISKLAAVKYLDLGALIISAALLFIVSYIHLYLQRRNRSQGSQKA
jgi:solute:Na+ symporter, SSS family